MNYGRLRPCRFTFDGETVYDGFTNDSYWNGFLNVWVTPETHAKVVADLSDSTPGDADEEALGGLDTIPVGENGLHCYGWGFCAMEHRE